MDDNEGIDYLTVKVPVEILLHIFSFLSYEQVGKVRGVCKVFNEVGSSILNSSFTRLQSLLSSRYQLIKSRMPRRESSRRNHPLAREWDIVETVHMRLTLLEMTFGKHIERKNCCFFPGEILDEVSRLYDYVTSATNLGRAFRVTDELFELTTMATDYFRECIEPTLPDIIYISSDLLDYSSWKHVGNYSNSCSSSSWSNSTDDKLSTPPSPSMALKKRIKRLRQGMKKNNSRLAFLKRELKSSARQMGEQQRQLLEYSVRHEEYDKKFEEDAHKFSCIFQELNKCKTELQFWRSKSPANPQLCYNCNAPLTLQGETSGQAEAPSEQENQNNTNDEFSRYFISVFNHESPSPKSVAQFVPISLNESEAGISGGGGTEFSMTKTGEMVKVKEEEEESENSDVEPAPKRRKKASVKLLIEC